MSQIVFDTINPSTTSGNQLAQILNDFKDAVMSGFIGGSRPSQIEAGGFWIDNSLQATLSVWDFKIFDGTNDIRVFRLNLATGLPSISGSENTFEVTRISADSVGPLFKLIKERIANNGQVLFGDTLGEIQFQGAVDDSTVVATAKIKAIALDGYTGADQGSALVFETTPVDSNLIAEFMRIQGDKLGIGLVNPDEKVHVRGSIKVEEVSDTVNSSEVILKKARVSGSGQVLNNDLIGQHLFKSTDETGVEIEVAKIEVKALENHTGTAQGTSLVISTKDIGENTYTEKIKVDNSGVTIEGLVVSSTNVQLKSEKGQANGYAPLNASSKIDSAYLPSYVDDVAEYANLAAFPLTGETGKIYVAVDTGKTYRWSGSTYVEISPSEVNSVAGKTGIVTLDKNDVGLNNVDNTSDATKNSAIATLTNKTIQGADFQDPSRLDVKKDTYANLVIYASTATNGQLCFATDTKAMYQVVDNVLTEVGGSGSGVGEKNFIANFNFETSLNGWATFKDADQALPENGTGGAANVTISRSTASPISGGASMLLSKTGSVSRRGEGFSSDFTIDNEARAKVITIRFDYQIVSGTYADNDITFWIYDVTNGTLIQPSAFQLKNTGIIDRATMEFQSNFSSTSYRLIAHISSTTAQDFVLRFDNVFVGRGVKSYGSVTTDWVSFTPTGSWTTNTTYTGKWRRVGDSAEFRVQLSLSGAPSSGGLLINLPFSIDTTKLNNTSGSRNIFGQAVFYDASDAGRYMGDIGYGSVTQVAVFNLVSASNTETNATPTSPTTFASGDAVNMEFRVPIQGWSSSQQLSQDADTRVVAASYVRNSSQSLNVSSDTTLIANTRNVDTHAAYNLSNGRYYCPSSGVYNVNATVFFSASAITGVRQLRLSKRNSSGVVAEDRYLDTINKTNTNNEEISLRLTAKIQCNQGESLEIVAWTNASGVSTIAGILFMEFERISGPSQIAASETVAVRATSSSGQSIAATSGSTVIFGNKSFDTHNAYNASTGVFTAPISGKYKIDSIVSYSSTSYTVGGRLVLYLYVNGSHYSELDRKPNFSASPPVSSITGSDTVNLLQGETVYIVTDHSESTARSLTPTAAQNRLTITRIGNY